MIGVEKINWLVQVNRVHGSRVSWIYLQYLYQSWYSNGLSVRSNEVELVNTLSLKESWWKWGYSSPTSTSVIKHRQMQPNLCENNSRQYTHQILSYLTFSLSWIHRKKTRKWSSQWCPSGWEKGGRIHFCSSLQNLHSDAHYLQLRATWMCCPWYTRVFCADTLIFLNHIKFKRYGYDGI